MYWPQAFPAAGIALDGNFLIEEIVTRTPFSSPPARYAPLGKPAIATVTGHSFVQTLSVLASKKAMGRRYAFSSLFERTTSSVASASCCEEKGIVSSYIEADSKNRCRCASSRNTAVPSAVWYDRTPSKTPVP